MIVFHNLQHKFISVNCKKEKENTKTSSNTLQNVQVLMLINYHFSLFSSKPEGNIRHQKPAKNLHNNSFVLNEVLIFAEKYQER